MTGSPGCTPSPAPISDLSVVAMQSSPMFCCSCYVADTAALQLRWEDRGHVGSQLVQPPLPSASALACSSSSFETRLGPDTMWCRKPIAAKAPIAASPAYLVSPFHNSTMGLMRGSLARPA